MQILIILKNEHYKPNGLKSDERYAAHDEHAINASEQHAAKLDARANANDGYDAKRSNGLATNDELAHDARWLNEPIQSEPNDDDE